MSEKQLEKVSFEYIRYANCWEDADVLLKGLQLDGNSKVMSIASAGDNSFSLLTANPELVVAVDISEVQLFLCELKIAAIKKLDRKSYMDFIGFNPFGDRLSVYAELKPMISEACSKYWDGLSEQIEGGVIHYGKFELYFQLFKKDFLSPIHDQATCDELFRTKSAEEQLAFHDNVWHSEAYEKMYRLFFGEKMMGERGRDPEFLKHVEGTVSDLVMAQEVENLRTTKAQNNYFLYYMVNNRFEGKYIPHYVEEGNYEKVKANIDKLVLHKGLLDSATEKYGDCTHFNLSDIFEYMDVDLFKNVSQQLIDNSAPKAKFAFWNLMVPRNMVDILPEQVTYNESFCKGLEDVDNGYFYRGFIVNQKK